MFAVIGQHLEGDTGTVLARCDSIVDARRVAYEGALKKNYRKVDIYDTSTAKMVVFSPTGQKIPSTFGDLVGSITVGRYRLQDGTMYFAPTLVPAPGYARSKGMKYRRYIIQKDGSLGEGGY